MRIAVLGGTFNPLHFGHLFIAQEVLESMHYHKIFFIPAHIPAHKEMSPVPAIHRMNITRLGIKNNKDFLAESCEIKRGGVSYSIETLEYLIQRYHPEGKPGLIIGDDLLDGFSRWKMAEELSQRANLIVVRRNSVNKISFPYAHQYMNNTLVNISSSSIRKRVAESRSIRYLVPEAVRRYIIRHELYR